MGETNKNKTQSSYRSLFKATSLFGGVQAYQILVQVAKSKIIALLLGPTGVGVQGLYTSATQLIQQVTSMGLSQSAVRELSEANKSGDTARVSRVLSILRRLVYLTGSLGLLAVVVFSPILSQVSFGNYGYIIPFFFLSCSMSN